MQNETSGPEPGYPIESVDRALRLLLLLRDRRWLSVSEAGAALGVAPSTAHRLLAMLHYRGFAVQDAATKAYGPGPVLAELGLAAVRGIDLRAAARPALERLVAEVGETVHLAILRGTDVLFLDSVECGQALRVADRTGMTLPAHATAAGKALLAGLPPERLREVFPHDDLPRFRPNTITRRADLERDLARVLRRGYATNVDESEAGVSAVAVPIRDAAGRIQAAITVSAPAARVGEAQVATIAEAARRAAEQVAAALR